MTSSVDFSKFGKLFQESLVQLLLEDRPFCDQMQEVLDVTFFEVKYLRVFKLVEHTDQTLFYIKIKLSFDLNNDKYVLMEVKQMPK